MSRLSVRKTSKLFVGGAFPRSESGRTFPIEAGDGTHQAALASRKDARDAVAKARKAQGGWSSRTAYNRGQVLYRVAEVLEGRRAQFVAELANVGASSLDPGTEVDASIDRWVWYAGWCDKIATVAGGAVPVAGPYFTFTVPEPMGVVAVLAPDDPPLLGLTSRLAPVLVGGNSAVVVPSATDPLVAITFAEVLATSDVPGGVVNILTGRRDELTPWIAGHADVDAIDVAGASEEQATVAAVEASEHVTRVHGRRDLGRSPDSWLGPSGQSPRMVLAAMETKTVWHPKGR